jgi:hypothetical protein
VILLKKFEKTHLLLSKAVAENYVKMAPRRNVYRVRELLESACEKENSYLHALSYFKAKVRRRESLRASRCLKVSS